MALVFTATMKGWWSQRLLKIPLVLATQAEPRTPLTPGIGLRLCYAHLSRGTAIVVPGCPVLCFGSRIGGWLGVLFYSGERIGTRNHGSRRSHPQFGGCLSFARHARDCGAGERGTGPQNSSPVACASDIGGSVQDSHELVKCFFTSKVRYNGILVRNSGLFAIGPNRSAS